MSVHKLAAVMSAGVALASAAPAAATDYLFTLTGSYTASFTLSSTPKPGYALSGGGFTLYDVTGTIPGASTGKVDMIFHSTRQFGGFDIQDYDAGGIYLLQTHGVQLYTGTEAAPVFRLGSFALAPSAGLDRYTLTISDANAAAVPEAATWAMMLAGVGAVGFALRRRQKINRAVRAA